MTYKHKKESINFLKRVHGITFYLDYSLSAYNNSSLELIQNILYKKANTHILIRIFV